MHADLISCVGFMHPCYYFLLGNDLNIGQTPCLLLVQREPQRGQAATPRI